MIDIIKENRKPTFGQKLSEGIGRGIEGAQRLADEMQAEKKQAARREQIKNLTGMELDDPDLQKIAFQTQMDRELKEDEYSYKAKEAAEKLKGENEAKRTPLKGALSSIDEMMKIRRKGNLGLGVGLWSSVGRGETARDKGSYETLGNSLISYATSIPIRNRVEFEKLAGHISDPSISDAEAEGILVKMKKIIQDSLGQYEDGAGEEEIAQPPMKKRSIGSFRKKV